MTETHSAYTDTETLIRLLDVAEGMPGAVALRERGYRAAAAVAGLDRGGRGLRAGRAVAELAERGCRASGWTSTRPCWPPRGSVPELDLRSADVIDLPIDDGAPPATGPTRSTTCCPTRRRR
jgi:hypothetical protein